MIKVFKSTETKFDKNGLQVLDKYIIDPVVSEEVNGIFQLDFSIPIKKSKYIEKENIVVAPTPKFDNQAFRISQIRKSNGLYHVTCYHIFYDLIHNLIEDINIVNMGASAALDKISSGCVNSHPFILSTDMSNKTANCRIVRYNPVKALLGDDDNTFVNRWGGEIERNNFKINMKKRLGVDSSVQIRYKKNLTGYEADIDYTQVTTKIMPKAADGVLLPEKYVESPKINHYHLVKTKVVEYSDIKIKDEGAQDSEGVNKEEAFEEMRKRARLEFSQNHVDEPRANYKVSFVDLEKTKEYKHIKKLESVNLGDTLKVIHKDENVDITARVISYKYNPISKSYIELELGNTVDKFTSITEELKRVNDKIETDLRSAVEDSKKIATKLLRDGFGGHVKIKPDRILIMDTDDENTAKKVWMWNKNGLGFSNTGVNGEFGLAMTLDGAIVADYITAGNLNANLIRAGHIKGKNFDLDLDSGNAYFGPRSLTKDNMAEELIKELKGKDGKAFKYNLISNGDFHIDVTKGEAGYKPSELNRWQFRNDSDKSKAYIKKPSGKSWVALEVSATDTIEINQYLDLKKNTKYYIKATIASEEMKLYYNGSYYTNITSIEDKYDYFTTINMSFTTHDSDTHFIQLDCKKKTTVRDVIISEEPISDDTEWYPSKFDGIGQDGKPGRDGRDGERGAQGPPGRDGSMADLPPALKDWSGKATEISGKYVFTPELFVGTNGDSMYSRTGIYVGSGIRARNLWGEFANFDGITGINNGTATWHLSVNGNGWIGNSQRAMWWNKDGELTLPKVKAREIEAGAITTDILYPGLNNRIVLESGYNPGDNDCMSIDTNADSNGGKSLRLKVNAGTYLRLSKDSAFSFISRGSNVLHFDPRQQYDLEFFGDRGRGTGKFNMYDAYIEAKCYEGQVAKMGIVTYEMQWSTSDKRLKTDIEYLSESMISNLTEFIKKLNIAEFYFKSDEKKEHKQISVIAQDIIKEFPELKNYIVNEVGEYYTVNSNNINFATIVTLQEEIKKREELESKVNKLENELEEIKKLLKKEGE